jgi:hypothetical protein
VGDFKMNKQQKELLRLIYWDLGLIKTNELDNDDRYYLNLCIGNLKDLIKELNIKVFDYE